MNINRFSKIVACVVATVGGVILLSAPANAQENTEEMSQIEEPAPAASILSFCDTLRLQNDGNTELVFELASDVADNQVYPLPAGQKLEVPAIWGSDGTILVAAFYEDQEVFNGTAGRYYGCEQPEPIIQPTASIVDCTTVLLDNSASTVDVLFAVGQSNKGGGNDVPAGSTAPYTVNFLFGDVEVEAYYGDQLVYEVKLVSPVECLVAVDVPPVPPTVPPTTPTTPVTEPEAPVIRTLEVIGECDLYTITNIGNIRTSEYDDLLYGVALNKNNEPPLMIYLEPGQSISFDLEVGDVVSLNLSDDWTVNDPSVFTATSCEDSAPQPLVPSTTAPVATDDPSLMVLPETGSPTSLIAQISALIVMVGGLLAFVARRPEMV